MPTEYEINADLQAQIIALITSCQDFGPLVQHEVAIKSCFVVKLDDDGEPIPHKGEPISAKKVSPLHIQFINSHFLVVVDYGFWNNASVSLERKEAALHHALMHIHVKVSDTKVAFSIRHPEIREFRATVRRYGAYHDDLQAFMQAARDVENVVNELA